MEIYRPWLILESWYLDIASISFPQLCLLDSNVKFWMAHAIFKRFALATMFARIVSTRLLSFSRYTHALCGMNPTPHVGIPMMPNKISKAKHTNKGHLTYSICCTEAWNSSHFNSTLFFTQSRVFFSFCFCLACGLFKIRRFITQWFCCLGPRTWIEGRPNLPTSMRSLCLLSKCWWSNHLAT